MEGERVDELQLCGMRILQKTRGFRFGMDAVLLSDFAAIAPEGSAADFGTGTGILPLLLIGRGKGNYFDAFELQPEMADMAGRTMALNHLEDRVRVHAMSVEQADTVLAHDSLDAVVCNPPYGAPGQTMLNPREDRAISRHQGPEGLAGWYRMAHLLLKGKGRFFMVYPAAQLLEAMSGLQAARLEPKRFRLVYPSADRPANLALIEAVKDGRPLLQTMPPLIIHNPDGSDTDELKRIYGLDGGAQR